MTGRKTYKNDSNISENDDNTAEKIIDQVSLSVSHLALCLPADQRRLPGTSDNKTLENNVKTSEKIFDLCLSVN